jgi:transposase
MDRRLIERTIEVARETGAFGAGPLRVALDSSPLWGAGRVEDTYHLLGHALRKALSVIARKPRRGLAEIAIQADVSVLGGPV